MSKFIQLILIQDGNRSLLDGVRRKATGGPRKVLGALGCALFQQLKLAHWGNQLFLPLLPNLSLGLLPRFYVPVIPSVQYLWERESHPVLQIPLLQLLSHLVGCFRISPFSCSSQKESVTTGLRTAQHAPSIYSRER
jgi:hypothetical protein